MRDGRSVDTTMGFTPLEGLVRATRVGSVDPGLVLWLEEHEQLSPREVATALEHRSGLMALAGTADMREVEHRAEKGDPRAHLALQVYVHRLGTTIDRDRNHMVAGDAYLTGDPADVRTLVVTAREDVQVAQEIRQLLR